MSSFLANATPVATYYSYGQQNDYPTNTDLNSNAGQTTASNYQIHSSFQDLSNTPPSGQSMNSSDNGLDLHLQQTHQLNGGQQGTPNQYQTTAQLTPPPSVSTEGSHQSPVLAYPSYRDYTELSNSNNSINNNPTPTTSSSTQMNNSTTTSTNSSNSQQSINQSNNQSPSHNNTGASLNPLLYSDNNNSMDIESGITPSIPTTYTPAIHNPYHLTPAHHSNSSNQFNLHHPQSTNVAFSQMQSTASNSNQHSQFANSQDGLINQPHHLLPTSSYHQLHHSHLNPHNQIQVQTPNQHSTHPHLHPQLNALNVAVHVHQFNSSNPSILPNGTNQTNNYLPDNHLTTTSVSAVSNAFPNSANNFPNSGLLAPVQPQQCSRNESPSSATTASLLLEAHNANGSGSNTPNNTANGFHSLMYHLNPLSSSNSPSPTLQQSQLHLAQQHHLAQNPHQFVQHSSHHSLTNPHSQMHPHQNQLAPQSAQQIIGSTNPSVGKLNHQPGQFTQHTYTQLNNATSNHHLNQQMHPMHFKMQTGNSNQQMNSFNSPSTIVNNNQSGSGNSRNSPNADQNIYKWMQVKRSQPKTGWYFFFVFLKKIIFFDDVNKFLQ